MKVPLSIMRSAASVTITGLMVRAMQDTGERTRWTAKASCAGKTERCTKASSSTIREKDRAPSSGPMAANTSANGRLASSTASAPT